MVNYKCLFCNYESNKKINIQEHYNKNKKCYTDEQIKEYKNMNDLILKSEKMMMKMKKDINVYFVIIVQIEEMY